MSTNDELKDIVTRAQNAARDVRANVSVPQLRNLAGVVADLAELVAKCCGPTCSTTITTGFTAKPAKGKDEAE